jgi:serine/threonine protein kinase
MGLILSENNVVDFLKHKHVCPPDFYSTAPIICKESKNFNLVVQTSRCDADESSDTTSSDRLSFLVKQNRIDREGKTSGHLITEWLVQELINKFSNLSPIQPLISEVVLFDQDNSILVSVFYDEYISLDSHYETCKSYHPQIAQTMGTNIAQVHRACYKQSQIKKFLSQYLLLDRATRYPRFIQRLNNISPSIFAEVAPDGLDFYKLYQRFPSLQQAVIELYDNLHVDCLTHNDLTLDNFIIDKDLDFSKESVQIKPEQVKIIDWELIDWGDPAVDLGMLLSQYLGEWLNSLVADPNLDLNTTLRLASCPLEKITPSLKALMEGYLSTFPEIIQDRPDYLRRIVQFAGIGLINRLSHYVEYHYPFNNDALCKLQVAKNLLCSPEEVISTIFGTSEAELINSSTAETASYL